MVYVHVPVCRRKCLYCDFYSVGERLADWTAFVDAVLAEAFLRREEHFASSLDSPHTLYIGGGTPSLMPEGEFMRLAYGLMKIYDKVEEFTIEVNPDDVTSSKVSCWRDCGVNRVSMGVQSLCDNELRAVGRRHTPLEAIDAFGILRRQFDNISLDLMFGLPLQTLESLQTTIDGFIKMDPEHISAYSLMYEELTALTRLRDSGELPETPEELSVQMFGLITDALTSAGYEQYEISNYSKSGKRSLHNSSYWHGCPYVGLGPGAHSYDGCRTRSFNPPDLKGYLAAGGRVLAEKEILTDDELREEMIMTRLRTSEGLDIEEFRSRFGTDAGRKLLLGAERFLKMGLVSISHCRLKLTRAGIMVSDEVMSSLF